MRKANDTQSFPVHGFTLMEALAALTIGSLLVISAVSATQALTTTREKMDRRTERSAQARRALETITGALRNVRRDASEADKPVVIGYRGDSSGGDRINLAVIDDRRVRRDGPESDQYEVSFFLSATDQNRPLPSLMCRRDHALDDHIEEGGIVTAVADGIVGLTFEYRAVDSWYNEWATTEMQPPEAVRVTVVAANKPESGAGSPDVLVLSTVVPIHAAARQADSTQKGDKSSQGEAGK